jgi:uncharacterized protein YndB with AHSA1/START domain
MSAAQMNLSREFDHPVEAVYKAFTEAEGLSQWWGGSRNVKIDIHALDVSVGGGFFYSAKYSDTMTIRGKFVYRVISPNQQLEFISGFADENGEFTRAFFSPQFPLQLYNVWVFEPIEGGRTRLTISGSPYNATEEETAFFAERIDKMEGGFNGTFDQLQEYLATL